jgi:hypothetical protein
MDTASPNSFINFINAIPGNILSVVITVIVVAICVLWYASIHVMFIYEKKLATAIKHADYSEYSPVYDADAVMRVASTVKLFKAPYFIFTIAFAGCTFLLGAICVIMIFRTKIDGGFEWYSSNSSLRAAIFVLTIVFVILTIITLPMFLVTLLRVTRATVHVNDVNVLITDYIAADNDFLTMLNLLPFDHIKVNPNANDRSKYYMDTSGFGAGQEIAAAKMIFTCQLYTHLMTNVSIELREHVKKLFSPAFVMFAKITTRFSPMGLSFVKMMSQSSIVMNFEDSRANAIAFLTKNVLCSDPTSCADTLSFAQYYGANRTVIDSELVKMQEKLTTACRLVPSDLNKAYKHGNSLYRTMTLVNGWVPTLFVLGTGFIVMQMSECKRWRIIGGGIIALACFPVLMRQFVY